MALGRVYYLSLRLASTEEPPAEEPDEPLDDDNSNDDACDSPRGEAALVCVPAILHEIAEDRASVARRGAQLTQPLIPVTPLLLPSQNVHAPSPNTVL